MKQNHPQRAWGTPSHMETSQMVRYINYNEQWTIMNHHSPWLSILNPQKFQAFPRRSIHLGSLGLGSLQQQRRMHGTEQVGAHHERVERGLLAGVAEDGKPLGKNVWFLYSYMVYNPQQNKREHSISRMVYRFDISLTHHQGLVNVPMFHITQILGS